MTKTITTISSREFSQNTSRAKDAAAAGPVFITKRGRPAHVLLNIDDYRSLTGSPRDIGEMLSMRERSSIEFEPPRMDCAIKPAIFDCPDGRAGREPSDAQPARGL